MSRLDGDDCCAKNFERTLFRSDTVVKYAKQHFIPYRFDRAAGIGMDLVKELKLSTEKPAVLVLDWEGDLLYKTQHCVNPRDCLKGMGLARSLTSSRFAYRKRVEKKLEALNDSIKACEYQDALSTAMGLKPDLLFLSLRKRVESQIESIREAGAKRLEEARRHEEKSEFAEAAEIYREVLKSFRRLQDIRKEADDGLSRASRRKAS